MARKKYKGNDGKVHTSIKLQWVRSADKIRSGDYTLPEKKSGIKRQFRYRIQPYKRTGSG